MALLFLAGTHSYAKNVEVGKDILLAGSEYEVLNFLGQGASGRVFHIREKKAPHHEWAMKIFTWDQYTRVDAYGARHNITKAHQNLVSNNSTEKQLIFSPRILKWELDPNRQPSPLERAALVGHPDTDIIILTAVAVSNLRQDLSRPVNKKPLERLELAHKILTDLLPEMATLTQMGFIHGDIKPGNILRSTSGRYGLNDFDSLTKIGSANLLTTETYAAPEWSAKKSTAHFSYDLYSLGVVILQTVHSDWPDDDSKVKAQPLKKRVQILQSLKKIKAELSPSDLNALDKLNDVESFLLSSLNKNPILREKEFLKTRWSQLFPLTSTQKKEPNLRTRQILDSFVDTHLSRAEVTKELASKPQHIGAIKDLVNSNDLFIPALRASQILNIPIANEREILISKLKSQPIVNQGQMDLLNAYLKQSHFVDLALAKILMMRFILPKNSSAITEPWVYDIVSRFPDVVLDNLSLIKKQLLENIPSHEKAKIERLFQNSSFQCLEFYRHRSAFLPGVAK
jgi:serine/threonine protein kinase